MIELVNVRKSFRQGKQAVAALNGVSLKVRPGEIYGIIGPSGAGKSTLIRCVNLLERPDSGEVWVDGRELTRLGERPLRAQRQSIGMIFQHFNLLSSRTVAANVAFPLELAGVPRASAAARVRELLELVGLADKASSYPSELSGGQKQRVAIARALANRPKVLLSDEATSALDPETTRSILALLRQINGEFGLTILLITHELAVIKEVCDRVAVIEGGRLVEEGPVVEVFAQPKSALTGRFVRGLFGAEVPGEFWSEAGGGNGVLVRLSFVGQSAAQPVISAMVRRFGVDANIVAGHLDHVGGVPFGQLVVALTGGDGPIEAGLAYLRQSGVAIEEVGRRAG
ncbi:MAG: methionine ABC transporter ATP-binding protein [Chitinophagales bacterium]